MGGHLLVERERESTRIRGCLVEACAGRGTAILVEGPAGIGKTALASVAAQEGRRLGMQILNARGGELEAGFPFGVVRQLFEKVLPPVEEDQQSSRAEGVRAIAERLLGEAPGTAAVASTGLEAYLHGLYWLTVDLAESVPIVMVVDDAHWADEESQQFMRYLGTRITELPVVLVILARPTGLGPPPWLSTFAGEPLFVQLHPAPISRDGVQSIVSDAGGLRDPQAGDEDEFVRACHELTGGNPYFIRQLLRWLDQHRPLTSSATELIQESGFEAVGDYLATVLADAPPDARALAAAAAVLGSDCDVVVGANVAALELGAARDAAEILMGRGVFESGARLEFRHPIVRSAILVGLPPGERAELHGRAAEVVRARGAGQLEVARHLQQTFPGNSATTVRDLLEGVSAARLFGAERVALAFLRRAAGEDIQEPLRTDVLLALAALEVAQRDPLAVEHLDAVIRDPRGPEDRATARFAKSQLLVLLDRFEEAMAEMVIGQDELAGAEGALADLGAMIAAEEYMMIEGHLPTRQAFERERHALDRRASLAAGEGLDEDDLISADPAVAARSRRQFAQAGVATYVQGGHVGPAIRLARMAYANGALLDDEPLGSVRVSMLVGMLLHGGELSAAAEIVERVLAASSRAGSARDQGIARAWRARIRHFGGDMLGAEADALGALELVTEQTGRVVVPMAVPTLVAVFTERGAIDEARRLIDGHRPLLEFEDTAGVPPLQETMALFHLQAGDAERAAAACGVCQRIERGLQVETPSYSSWRAILALVRLEQGAQTDAAELADDALRRARVFGAPRQLGWALRASAAVGPSGGRSALLREATDILRSSGHSLEAAHASMELGQELAVIDGGEAAKEHLLIALEQAHRSGALALRDRAYRTLVSLGVRPRRMEVSGFGALTPAERRIAELAADGATNREVAERSFLSLKTVEGHLSSVYRKLGISGRGELASVLDA